MLPISNAILSGAVIATLGADTYPAALSVIVIEETAPAVLIVAVAVAAPATVTIGV